jgi:hypothetical protein
VAADLSLAEDRAGNLRWPWPAPAPRRLRHAELSCCRPHLRAHYMEADRFTARRQPSVRPSLLRTCSRRWSVICSCVLAIKFGLIFRGCESRLTHRLVQAVGSNPLPDRRPPLKEIDCSSRGSAMSSVVDMPKGISGSVENSQSTICKHPHP